MGINLLLRFLYIFLVTTSIWIFSNKALARPHYATLIMEYPSQRILSSENSTTLNQPASLTKVMTLYLVFQALDNGNLTMSQQLHVSLHAANRQPSKLGLRTKDKITVEEAIQGLVTKSANDAASVIAENMAPTEEEFAQRMTEQAKKLGLNNTTFKNASGIPNSQQLTNAIDMALLGAAIMQNFPQYYHYFSLKKFYFNHRAFKNHNHLLEKYPGCDGIKTGYTVASGFNLISSATRDGHRLIGVVLGGKTAKSRDLLMMDLLDSGFAKLAKTSTSTISQPAQKNNPLPSESIYLSPKPTENIPKPQAYLTSPNTVIEEAY